MRLLVFALLAGICALQTSSHTEKITAEARPFSIKSTELSAATFLTGGEKCKSTFLRLFGNPGTDEESFFLTAAPDSNFYLAGRQGSQSILLLIDQAGNVLGKRSFDFTQGNDFIANLMVDSEGFIIGSSRDQFNTNTINILFKYDWANDQFVWSKRITNPAYIRFDGVFENPASGNYVFHGLATGEIDNYIVETDRNTGNIQRQFQSDYGAKADVLQGHFVTPDAVYFAGQGRLGGALTDIRPTLTKFDHAGNMLWSKIHLRSPNQPSRLYNHDLIVENDTIVSIGRGTLAGADLSSSVLIFYKTSLEGELHWAKSYTIPGGSGVAGFKVHPVSGGYIVQGSYLQNGSTLRLFFARLNKNGGVVWVRQINTETAAGLGKPLSVVAGDFVVFAAQTSQFDNGATKDLLFGQIPLDGVTDSLECELIETVNLLASVIENPYDGIQLPAGFPPDYVYANFSPSAQFPDLPEFEIPGCECSEVTDTFAAEMVIDIPNVVSPNGDGINDTFYPLGKGISEVRLLRIFDRWGEKVFERKNFQPNEPALGWDGTFKGKPAVSDVFAYYAVFVMSDGSEEIVKGDLTLLR